MSSIISSIFLPYSIDSSYINSSSGICLNSIQREKDTVKEVKKGLECGITITNFNDIKVGDVIEAYEMVEKK